MISPAFAAMLDAILDLAWPIVLAALIVGLINELAGPEESEEQQWTHKSNSQSD